MIARAIIFGLCCCLAVCDLWAQNGTDIRVDQITAYCKNDSLLVSATFDNLFSRKIIGTIQSGLPSIVNVEIQLLENAKKQLLHKLLSRSISYDLWAERYTVAMEDTSKTFVDFEHVKQKSSQVDSVFLIRKSALSPAARYSVNVRVAIIPISSRQGAKVDDWLTDPNQTEELLASEERSSGFKFTLSNLVSFFVRDRRQSKYYSDWHSSTMFTTATLK